MRQINDRFALVLRTEEGNKFRGEFGDPNAYPRPRKEIQNLPHRSLTTSRTAMVKGGDLVSHTGRRWLICGQHTLQEAQTFLAVEVNRMMVWSRFGEIVDPVTRMPKDTAKIILDGALAVAVDTLRGVDEVRFEKDVLRVFTSADVQDGDLLDGYTVLRGQDILGLRMVEVS